MCVCVYVCIYVYMHMCMGVHLHLCRRILFICTVQSLYYMRVYHKCFFNTCMRVWLGDLLRGSSVSLDHIITCNLMCTNTCTM